MSTQTDPRLSLDADAIQALLGRSLLKTPDYDTRAMGALVSVAEAFARLDAAGVKTPLLPAELAYAVFFDNSTRTKSAWAGAAARLGMQPVIVDGSSTQVAHGETAEETGAMLGMNAHALGIRHDLILGEGRAFLQDLKKGIDDYNAGLGTPRQVPVVNLQCDLDHPTQAIADLMFLREKFGGDIRGKKIAVSWAYSPSYAKPLSVPQGLIMLLSRYGAELTLAQPEGYPLLDESLDLARAHSAASGGSFRVTHDMDDAFRGADVVYPKSWGPLTLMQERVTNKDKLGEIEARMLAQNAQFTDWICDERRMGLTHNAQYMHCLPADIGAEVTAGVMDRFRFDLAREANQKLYVIMAMLATAKVPGLAAQLERLWETR